MNPIIRFGPSGNSRSFYEQGHKQTIEAPLWLHALGLNAFEYSFGRGIRGSAKLWRKICEASAPLDIALSIHAPYYINFCNEKDEMRKKSRRYLVDSIKAAVEMGATRVVFHPGSAAGLDRDVALGRVLGELEQVLAETDTDAQRSVLLCPETMGKHSQFGTIDEVLELCALDRNRLAPTLDFGHINARGQGSLAVVEDYEAVFDSVEERLGETIASNVHIHFSRIEYGKHGEVRHLTFDDDVYGPYFEPLAQVLAQRGYTPVVICESAGTMAEDALEMKHLYELAL